MKRVVAVLLVLVMVYGCICYAEVDQAARDEFMDVLEMVGETKDIRASLSSKIQKLSEKRKSGDELNNREAIVYAEAVKIMIELVYVGIIEMGYVTDDTETVNDMNMVKENIETLRTLVEKVNAIEDMYLIGMLDRKTFADTITECYDAVLEYV